MPAFLTVQNISCATTKVVRPVIGISGAGKDSRSVMAMLQMIHRSGALPLLLCEHKERTRGSLQLTVLQDISRIHGLIVMGNDDDVDPVKYGASIHNQTCIERDEARTLYEERMIETAIKTRVPLLGICGGMQRINILCGGTLHQHLPDLIGHDNHRRRDVCPTMAHTPIRACDGTQLAILVSRVSAGSVIHENSLHHQAVDKPGRGLQVSATSCEDGFLVVKAIEAAAESPYANQFLMGVQWHPEYGASPLGQTIIDSFVEHADRFMKDAV